MGEEEPRWFYIGNGQLRSKDSNGWTDDYQDIDGPKRVEEVEVPTSSEVLGSAGKTAGPGPLARALSSLGTHVASAARRMMAHLIRLTVASWRLLVAAFHWLLAACGRLFAHLSARLGARKQQGPSHRAGGRHRGGADSQRRPSPHAPQGDEGLQPVPSRRVH